MPHEQNPWGTTTTYGDLIRPDNPQRFLNIKYRINEIEAVGYSGSRDDKLLKFGYENKGVDIIECTYQKGIWTEKKVNIGSSWFPINVTQYNASYEGNNLLINKSLTGTQLKEEYPDVFNALVQRIQVIKAGNILSNYLGGVSKTVLYNPTESVNLSYGYTVRCVKEKSF